MMRFVGTVLGRRVRLGELDEPEAESWADVAAVGSGPVPDTPTFGVAAQPTTSNRPPNRSARIDSSVT